MAADALAVGDDFESWTGIGSLHLQGDPPGRWCDRQAAASSLLGRVPCYLTPACSAPTRNSRARVPAWAGYLAPAGVSRSDPRIATQPVSAAQSSTATSGSSMTPGDATVGAV